MNKMFDPVVNLLKPYMILIVLTAYTVVDYSYDKRPKFQNKLIIHF